MLPLLYRIRAIFASPAKSQDYLLTFFLSPSAPPPPPPLHYLLLYRCMAPSVWDFSAMSDALQHYCHIVVSSFNDCSNAIWGYGLFCSGHLSLASPPNSNVGAKCSLRQLVLFSAMLNLHDTTNSSTEFSEVECSCWSRGGKHGACTRMTAYTSWVHRETLEHAAFWASTVKLMNAHTQTAVPAIVNVNYV